MSLLLKISGIFGEDHDAPPGRYDPATQIWSPDLRSALVTMTGTSTYRTLSGTTNPPGGQDDDKDDEQADPEPGDPPD